ncbi:hypothetical protein [Micromonospora fulviviridis]|nr:hypothetical protein [Micromonospora fulviviridis]
MQVTDARKRPQRSTDAGASPAITSRPILGAKGAENGQLGAAVT